MSSERARLVELAIESADEPFFGSLVHLTSELLSVPISLVTLVTEGRLVFTARHGSELQSADRARSFCGEVVDTDAPLVVEDARLDPRFSESALVTELGARFYAGVPLRARGGIVLGTLCAIDREPRVISAKQITWLELLAAQVVAHIELRRRAEEIDERDERARAQMERNERLATVGTLAAGIGHEINNPLSYVKANLEIARDDLQSGRLKRLDEILGDASEGVDRIVKIVQSLRAFARADGAQSLIEVNAILDASVKITMHELRKRATVVTEIDATSPVLGDEARLHQVFVNLLLNAAQSFDSADLARNHVIVRAHQPTGGSVTVTVSDNGRGIAPEVMPRIYDAFFTTQPSGKNAGLGLAVSHDIIVAMGGTIECQSAPGEGTMFTVTLPAARAPLPDTGRARRSGRVLVIDDEVHVLRAIARILHGEQEVVTFSVRARPCARWRTTGATTSSSAIS